MATLRKRSKAAMKLADFIAMAWLLALFLCALLSPFVLLGMILSHLWSLL